MKRTWPEDWEDRKVGVDCPMCGPREAENSFGGRFLAGRFADVALQRDDVQRGYSVAVWHGRHVSDPTELTDEEAAGFWLDVVTASRAIQQHFRPAKLNIQILGNHVPHLHAHIIPRYVDDPAPERPLPWPTERQPEQDPARFRADLSALLRLTGHG